MTGNNAYVENGERLDDLMTKLECSWRVHVEDENKLKTSCTNRNSSEKNVYVSPVKSTVYGVVSLFLRITRGPEGRRGDH